MKKQNNIKRERLRKKRLRKYIKWLHKWNGSPPVPDLSIYRRPEILINVAPKHFSFVENTDEMLEYFEKGRSAINKKQHVDFYLKEIQTLTPDGIAIFASLFTDPNYHKGVYIKGNVPDKPELQEMFFGSGFYDHVKSQQKPPKSDHHFLLHKVSNKKVDPSIAKIATDFAAKYSFKDNRIIRPIYEILIELMANTNNHANPIEDGYYDWWLYVFYDKETNITSYSFLDFGVGIFKSKPFLKYCNLLILTIGKNKSTMEMAQDLLEGRITSRTGLDERGRGFPSITQNASQSIFRKFVIISNNAYINVKTKISTELTSGFDGTFIYWEIQNDN